VAEETPVAPSEPPTPKADDNVGVVTPETASEEESK
jgi:hypothetical protein